MDISDFLIITDAREAQMRQENDISCIFSSLDTEERRKRVNWVLSHMNDVLTEHVDSMDYPTSPESVGSPVYNMLMSTKIIQKLADNLDSAFPEEENTLIKFMYMSLLMEVCLTTVKQLFWEEYSRRLEALGIVPKEPTWRPTDN